MKLSEWLEKNTKTQRWLASKMKCDQGRISRLVTGAVMPSAKTIALVEKITDGEVELADWLTKKPKPKKPKCVGPTCSLQERE